MIVPIQFDDELVRNAGEVHDIISYDMLSFEGHSQAICFQILPQQAFCFCWIITIFWANSLSRAYRNGSAV